MKYMTDIHTVRTMKTVKAALNTITRQNVVYKITPRWRQWRERR